MKTLTFTIYNKEAKTIAETKNSTMDTKPISILKKLTAKAGQL